MIPQTNSVDSLRLAFVCVENAGRSQIAAAIAETQVQIQDRTDIEILSGGTDPAEEIYPAVIDVMREKGYDLSTRTPTQISRETLKGCDVVALMGCSLSVDDLPVGVVVRDWGFIDPADADVESVWAISTEIEQRVIELIADLPTEAERRNHTHQIQ
ncbi:low molecular weight phosphatase family protein (plasmid) [Halorussus limi]|uniref:Low molecular weight phosphatase family protein n=1 Tax=Halorussus limi TaxID=2938695 RepID=A0A8U0I320_9EURY|nr:low molecular weight phosphatase family protein [Halorussus limi]UPV77034.1 low molecular weight phosphatase family protein [Halorussus limi]